MTTRSVQVSKATSAGLGTARNQHKEAQQPWDDAGQTTFFAEVTGGGEEQGWTVNVLDAKFSLSGKTFTGLGTFPGGVVLATGDKVLLHFRRPDEEPIIVVAGGSGVPAEGVHVIVGYWRFFG